MIDRIAAVEDSRQERDDWCVMVTDATIRFPVVTQFQFIDHIVDKVVAIIKVVVAVIVREIQDNCSTTTTAATAHTAKTMMKILRTNERNDDERCSSHNLLYSTRLGAVLGAINGWLGDDEICCWCVVFFVAYRPNPHTKCSSSAPLRNHNHDRSRCDIRKKRTEILQHN